MSSKGIWDDVDKLLKEGKLPVIKISEVAKVQTKGGKKGRKRVRSRSVNKPYDHFVMHTPGGRSPMSCRAPGCRNRMKSQQRDIVCGPKCRALLTEYCKVLLSILNGELAPEELPSFMRTHKLKRILR